MNEIIRAIRDSLDAFEREPCALRAAEVVGLSEKLLDEAREYDLADDRA